MRKYIAVIWPTGFAYRDEIRKFYVSQDMVTRVSDFAVKRFSTPGDFMNFIYAVYEKDDLSREILKYKSHLMVEMNELDCAVFSFSVVSDVEESVTDDAVLSIKTQIREIIAAKMDNYYYDILVHVTDTCAEYDNITSVMARYDIEL